MLFGRGNKAAVRVCHAATSCAVIHVHCSNLRKDNVSRMNNKLDGRNWTCHPWMRTQRITGVANSLGHLTGVCGTAMH